MTVVWTALTAVLFLLTIVAHEFAHAAGLRRIGVEVTSAGVGFFKPRIRIHRRELPDGRTRSIYLSPWLLGAWVRHDEEDHHAVEHDSSYHDYQWFVGAGIVANFVLGGGLVTLALVLGEPQWLAAGIVAAVAVLIWVFRRGFAAYVLPALSVPMLVLVLWSLLAGFGEQQGPIAVAKVMAVDSFDASLGIAGLLSISLGLVNAMPLYPLDGGRMMWRVLERLVPAGLLRTFETVGVVLVTGVMLYSVVSDFVFA